MIVFFKIKLAVSACEHIVCLSVHLKLEPLYIEVIFLVSWRRDRHTSTPFALLLGGWAPTLHPALHYYSAFPADPSGSQGHWGSLGQMLEIGFPVESGTASLPCSFYSVHKSFPVLAPSLFSIYPLKWPFKTQDVVILGLEWKTLLTRSVELRRGDLSRTVESKSETRGILPLKGAFTHSSFHNP